MTHLFHEILLPELFKEIRNELQEAAENHVIAKCKEAYNTLLMTGPFTVNELNKDYERRPTPGADGKKKNANQNLDQIDIPDRPRCAVMGLILH